jgi:DNA-directed RNA polymerase specialized sigma24 family protein
LRGLIFAIGSKLLKADGKIAIIQSLSIQRDGHLQDPPAEREVCALIDKLMAHALRVFAEYRLGGKDAVVPGIGKSAEDFAYETLAAYLTDKKLKNKDIPYLLTALRNDIIDSLRLHAHSHTEHMPASPPDGLDPENTRCLESFSSQEPRADDRVCEEEYKDRVRASVADEPRLREVVEAVLDMEETKPAGIAEVLDIPATEVNVRQKTLRRRLIGFGKPGGAS